MSLKEIISKQKITDTLELNFMPYAMSVIVSRAIPDIDGFKPAHRKLLYTMYKMGLLTGSRTKSSNVVGQTMKLNPHGDGAIYETLVRLTRGNEALLAPLVDSKGNFGKQYSRDMAYAAARYTEVKLEAICSEVFKDIDKNTVEFVDNYDGEMKEPLFLPTSFPNILANPNQGIAVGMASSICSFNLKELCEGTIAYIKNPEDNLAKYIKAPDFSTGAELLYNEQEMEQIYRTGKGSFKLRAKYRFDKKNNCIEIYEIPYTTAIEIIIDKIIALIKSGKIREINDVRDETDLNGLKITLDVKKNTNVEILMHKLFSMTSLQDSFSCNFNILIDGSPRVMGVYQILDEWLRFRVGCIRRQISYDIEKKSEKLHLLEALSKILLDIDKAIKIVRDTEEDKNVVPNLMAGFNIDEIQADFIAEIKLRNLNKEYILKRLSELNDLNKELEELKITLKDDIKINNIIIKQLKDISKTYAKPRRTDIISEEEIPSIDSNDLIEDYPLKLFLTDHSYLKKISLISLRMSSDQKLKDDDKLIQEADAFNKSELLLFSNKANVYKIKAYELSDSKASSLGDYLANLLSLEEEEKIIYVTDCMDYKGYMLFGFENGKMAKVIMEAYATKFNRKKLINAYGDKDKLVFIKYTDIDLDLLLIRDKDKATLFNTSLMLAKATKNSVGVQVMTIKKGSRISKIELKENIEFEDIEYYRTDKIPSTGHFLREKDRRNILV